MKFAFLDHLYILATIIFTVIGQFILKWRVKSYGSMPNEGFDKAQFLISIVFDPWVLLGLTFAFMASFAWIAAMTKFELSYAYPYMSLTFVAVVFLGAWLFNEPLTVQKLMGVAFIVIGTVIVGRA